MTDDISRMTSHRPYLLRALVEWINDNGMTPHILVDAGLPNVQVPPSTVKDGRVVLNIAERAVVRLQIDNDGVSFTARFGGVSYPVQVPMAAVLAVYARETGQGMALPDDIHGAGEPPGDDTPPPPRPSGSDDGAGGKRPHLRVVK
ncbi:ClpXP protease specificity-enhancing factor [Xanthomonas graminis]|jgi:stringent starvation protein B|uniref:ClpXP protease specificity-enhancing factor n=1 Tax=Xanthomonas graminis pv. graminis TaxID=134874 RepID=A0A1M4JJB8_9XANT|nr:ClpXP protease specificity-enhancing factor [Xanthomonas translucens]EKU25002.1 Stringent starvation protein B [Xanthomonas translucens pv. graminis ART-Xtg29]OAX60573.1 ClpXP protease specificity-enhancing factor [Xanthomonas translucens pv. graminis]UKE55756.1 ClpXP protease specificity-enhancing factor [Xanthomonas translucens pv. graminis]WIH10131.1 ClpXP protease specificity-enhancing factor [Xanthomonas translucens pv. graminis]WIH13531.1 ClpXP protease specificity-enhancing factor [X